MIKCFNVSSHWAGVIASDPTQLDLTELEEVMDVNNDNVSVWMLSGQDLQRGDEEEDDDEDEGNYGLNLDLLSEGSKVGLMVNDIGELHYYLNGEDKGCAFTGIPEGLCYFQNWHPSSFAHTQSYVYNHAITHVLTHRCVHSYEHTHNTCTHAHVVTPTRAHAHAHTLGHTRVHARTPYHTHCHTHEQTQTHMHMLMYAYTLDMCSSRTHASNHGLPRLHHITEATLLADVEKLWNDIYQKSGLGKC